MKLLFNKKGTLFFLLALFFAGSVFSRTSFSANDINNSDQLLYTAQNEIPGNINVSTLFLTRLGKKSVEEKPIPLTCVPQKIELLSGNEVQLRNAFGSARYNLSSGKLVWTWRLDDFPSKWNQCSRQCESPDGKWICLESSSGALELVQPGLGLQVKISDECNLSGKALVKWSADSKFFLYEENGCVYFASTDGAVKKMLPPQSMRKIGDGTLANVQWVGETIFYVDSDMLYCIDENELFTRGVYYSVVGCGTPVARLTTAFDSYHDSFWCSPNKKFMLYANENKSVSLYSIPKKFGFVSVREMDSLVGLSGSILDIQAFWTATNVPVLWIENLSYSKGKKSASVYKMDKGLSLLENYDEPGEIAVSPDGSSVAFSHKENLEIRKIDNWKKIAETVDEKVLSFKWKNNSSIIAGGVNTLFKWETLSSKKNWEKEVLYLSSVKKAAWDSGKIYAWLNNQNQCYEFDQIKNKWTSVGKKNMPAEKSTVMNGKFRVYTSECPNENFSNAIFVRSLTSPAFTYPLVSETGEERKLKGKVSIVFDATDGNEGLAQVLAALEIFGLKSTFFINGEFIRRYPMETCQIVASGNRCASGFFTTADLLSKDFTIDADFIRRGLARNEDEFFAATGKELELLWHAPLYRVNEMMINAGESAGYNYVDARNEFSDRVSFEDALNDSEKKYFTADGIVKSISENLCDGMVLCVDVGKIKGSRSDYLYEKIQNLIEEIYSAGYDIVPLTVR